VTCPGDQATVLWEWKLRFHFAVHSDCCCVTSRLFLTNILWLLYCAVPVLVAARPLARWDCGFEFHWGAWIVSVVCCQVEVCATSWSLVQRSPIDVCRECCVLSGRGLCDGLITCPEESYGCLSVVSVVCCQVEVCATSWSLVQRSPIDVCLLWVLCVVR